MRGAETESESNVLISEQVEPVTILVVRPGRHRVGT